MLASLCCKVLLLFLGILSLIISVLTFILTYVKQTSTLFQKNKKIFLFILRESNPNKP